MYNNKRSVILTPTMLEVLSPGTMIQYISISKLYNALTTLLFVTNKPSIFLSRLVVNIPILPHTFIFGKKKFCF